MTFKDMAAGCFLIAGAVYFVGMGSGYRFGTLLNMGAGFFPTVAGTLLGVLGVFLLVAALKEPEEKLEHPLNLMGELRAVGAVSSALIVFALALERVGLVVATILLVGISALAERRPQFGRTVILAGVLAVIGVVIFINILGIRMPVFRWQL